jgi:O-antigen/teichoic acid export membrane protein
LLFGFLRGLGLLAPLLIARFFSEDMFGTYTLAKLAVFFFVTLLINAPLTPFVVFAGREKTEAGKINKSFSVQFVFFIFGVILSAILILLFNSRIRSFAGVTVTELIYMSLGFLGIAISYFLSNLFLALGQRIKNAMAECAFGSITLGLVIVLCFTGKLNLQTIFGAYFVSAVIVLVIFARTIDVAMLRPFHFDFGRFREMFNFTKWIFIGAAATYFIDWGDNVILKIFHISLADIGQYSLAYSIFNGLVTLIYVLNSYFLPFVSQNVQDSARMRDYLFSKRPRILLFGVVLLAAVFIACPFLFKVFYPGTYHESVFVLRILLVGCVPVLYNTFYFPLLNALQLYRFSQTASIAHMLLKVALNVLLIRAYGLYGAAAGTVVSYLFATVIYECYYRIKMKRLLLMKIT